MQFISAQGGLITLGIFFVLMFGCSILLAGRAKSKDDFLVANRGMKVWPASFSAAASWTWAPALFLATQQAFQHGYVGWFWFTVPNILALIVFSEFAQRLRDKMPLGYTLSEYMLERHSVRVQKLYLVEMLGLAICSLAVQLLAGGLIFSAITGLPFWLVSLVMMIAALSYSLFGIRASFMTDYIQMAVILGVSAVVVPWAVYAAGGPEIIKQGLYGITGEFTSLFSGAGGALFFSFGISATIGLLAAPYGDQMYWQRALSIKQNRVRRSFALGGLIFTAVPVLLGILGFLAAGVGMQPGDVQLINLQVIAEYLPTWVLLPFAFMLVCGLGSTLDSALCAISSISGKDFVDMTGSKRDLAKIAMPIAATMGLLIANIPGMQILYLWLFFGTFRAAVTVPTMLTIGKDKVSESGVFWGILASVSVGLPVFVIGSFAGIPAMIAGGSILTVSLSGVTAYIKTKLERAMEA